HAEAPASGEDGPAAAEAMNLAFATLLRDIAPWVATAVGKVR
ncbi:MAG: hypothetical protein JWN07_265, partial [Hyphomicrobiales bacterium]|nr:hypothetical protein [Hyphomicrobiales bacterium]